MFVTFLSTTRFSHKSHFLCLMSLGLSKKLFIINMSWPGLFSRECLDFSGLYGFPTEKLKYYFLGYRWGVAFCWYSISPQRRSSRWEENAHRAFVADRDYFYENSSYAMDSLCHRILNKSVDGAKYDLGPKICGLPLIYTKNGHFHIIKPRLVALQKNVKIPRGL